MTTRNGTSAFLGPGKARQVGFLRASQSEADTFPGSVFAAGFEPFCFSCFDMALLSSDVILQKGNHRWTQMNLTRLPPQPPRFGVRGLFPAFSRPLVVLRRCVRDFSTTRWTR